MKQSEYTYREYEDEYEFIVGSVPFQNGKVVYTEVYPSLLGKKDEIEKLDWTIKGDRNE